MVGCKKHVPVVIALLCIGCASFAGVAQQTGIDEQVRPALRVVNQSQAGSAGLSPAQIRNVYGFDQVANQGEGQVIAIVDAYDHPRIEKDLAKFSKEFDLPECDSSSGCFQKIYASGERPDEVPIWTLEIALDVEWAHAIAPKARILLVEAASADLSVVLAAVDVAVNHGANVVSMSWGVQDFRKDPSINNHFLAPGVMFVAGSGDRGGDPRPPDNGGAFYPASSPYVLGVGGTTLQLDQNGHYFETAWRGSGGGQSPGTPPFELAPLFQSTFPIPNNPAFRRGVPDVAYNADPDFSGYPVYNSAPAGSTGLKGWLQVGGTSTATPQWAGLVAIANSIRAANNKLPLSGSAAAFYQVANSTTFNDITTGSNGSCENQSLCTAAVGYDYVTGLGTPRVNNLIAALASQP